MNHTVKAVTLLIL